MLKVNFDPFPVLVTDRLLLRRTVVSDAERLFQMRSDKRVMQYIIRPLATSIEDVLPIIAIFDELLASNEGIHWAICLKEENLFIGNISLFRFKKEHSRAELGYYLHSEYWNKGIMSEAIQVTLKYAFETMEANSVEADINPTNLASAKILERNGFEREAFFKERYFWQDSFRDSAVFSLLSSDWKQK